MCDNVNDFITLLTSVFIVAYSEYDGKDTDGNDVICAQKQQYLFQIKSFTFTDNDDNDRKYDYDLDILERYDILVSLINNVREETKKIANAIVEREIDIMHFIVQNSSVI